MNDPDRWRTSDQFDDDAIFAEIVAHLDDDTAEAEPSKRTIAGDAGAGIGATAGTSGSTDDQPPDATDDATDQPASGAIGHPAGESTDLGPPAGEATDQLTGEAIDQAQPSGVANPWLFNQPQGPPTPDRADILPMPQAWRAHQVDDEYDEHFEPPPTAPLPAGDLQFWAIVAGMGGGPLLLLYFVFFNRDAGGYWMLSAIAMSVGGFALLISRLPRDREDDDDDGARL